MPTQAKPKERSPFTVRLPEDLERRLRQQARRQRSTASDLVRAALARYLEEEPAA